MQQQEIVNMAGRTLPRYAPARMIYEDVAPVPAKKLREWARQGRIGCSKCGPAKQAPALYKVDDVLTVLEAYADGRQPTRRRGR